MEDQIQAIHDASIPDAPWYLQGTACLSLWRLSYAELGPLAPAPELRCVTVGRHAFVAVVWAQYTGGTLRYDELAFAVWVRGTKLLMPAGSVTAIWVDDAVSAAGGRRLWRIPKALAQFKTLTTDTSFIGQMSLDGRQVAALQARVHELMRTLQRRELAGQAGSAGHSAHTPAGLAADLEASLQAADLVICQTGCMSHGDYWRVQDHCKRTGKLCMLVDQPDGLQIVRIHRPHEVLSS